MNWETFLSCMLLAVSIMWFAEQPQTTVQKATLWLSYAVASWVYALAMPVDQWFKNTVIFALPLLAVGVYRGVVRLELKAQGKRALENEQQAITDWRQDAMGVDICTNGAESGGQTDGGSVQESAG